MSVLLPGSYDPITVGHLDIIKRAAQSEDEVFVVAFINEAKSYRFTERERLAMLEIATSGIPGVRTDLSHLTVVDYMKEHGIDGIVKGYRDEKDLEWENYQAEYNKEHGGFETVLLQCRAELAHVSSTLVRRRLDAGEEIDDLVSEGVAEFIQTIKR